MNVWIWRLNAFNPITSSFGKCNRQYLKVLFQGIHSLQFFVQWTSRYHSLLAMFLWNRLWHTHTHTHRSPTVGDSFSNYEVVYSYTYDPKTVDLYLYVGSFTKPMAWYIYTCDSKNLDLHGSAFDPKTVNLDILTFLRDLWPLNSGFIPWDSFWQESVHL